MNPEQSSLKSLNRRQFVGTMGGATLTLLGGGHAFAGRQPSKNSYLVEAAHIAETGGWVLDTQFHNVLGFSYLLAHGLGRPVRNAKGEAKLPQAGKYHVWVHTRDWCPGDWEAPGRFRILVNGKPLDGEFGTEPGWNWQSGGTIEVTDPSAEIELQDLTGFDGRCSAVYFSLDPNDKPPAEKEALLRWRMEKLGISAEASETLEFDLVIVGGGITGCAAALAADSQGLKVALVHNRPVLGGNASAEIRVHTIGIPGPAEAIISRIDTGHWPNGADDAIEDDKKRTASMNAAKGVRQFLMHTMIEARMKGAKIESILACQTASGKITEFKAPVFVDCTGDGWLGVMAGAEMSYGRESKDEFDEGWEKHGDLWSPESPDNRVMGTSVLWEMAPTDERVTFPEVPWAMPVAKDHVSPGGGEWYWEYSDNDIHQVDDAEEIRDHMLRAIYGTYANNIRNPKMGNMALHFVAFNGGKRESRRLIGDHLFTGVDSRDSIPFPDTVAVEKRDIDIHYQRKLQGDPLDFLSKAIFQKPKDGIYYIPFRSLYSKNIENLMMAGRCFSCSHVGLGGPRVMKTCGQMGAATGYAATLCKKHRVPPRGVYQKHLAELKKLCGTDGDLKALVTGQGTAS